MNRTPRLGRLYLHTTFLERRPGMAKRSSEWNTLITAIETAGWAYRPCKRGLYVYPSDRTRRPVTLPGTPGEFRSLCNARAQLRRAGLTGI